MDNIAHIESQSLNSIAVVKVFFQPGADITKAIAQVTAISQTQLGNSTWDNSAAGHHL